jgi:CelD/BcsL family acetyltransferase involved in cellulose biosynthesis
LARFETFMAIEDSGWKGANGTSIRRRTGYDPFFRELVRSASRGKQLAWYTLRADDRPIAMYLAMRTHDTLWLPKIAYDESFAAHAPGMVLKHNVLLESLGHPGIRRVDNISATPWVRLWKPSSVSFRSLMLFSRSARSVLVHRSLTAKRVARCLVGRPQAGPGPEDRPYL